MDELVSRGYDRVADADARLGGDVAWPRTRWLDDLLRRLAPSSRVLDLGCGSVVPALRGIVEQGHAAIGVDDQAGDRPRRHTRHSHSKT
jgi:ubiquinone/menaquinone biosynthesis C-methylase UbiE